MDGTGLDGFCSIFTSAIYVSNRPSAACQLGASCFEGTHTGYFGGEVLIWRQTHAGKQ